MWTADYYVRYVAMPYAVEGVTVPDDDGTFDIYINSRLPEEKQREKLSHELWHIQHDHFYADRPVTALEIEARTKIIVPDRPVPPPGCKLVRLFSSQQELADWMLGKAK